MPSTHESPEFSSAGAPLVLETAALRCARNDALLFTDLDLTVAAGEVLLVGGTNGSGKSTLLRLLCGLASPDGGSVRWCGNDIAELGAEFRAALEYVGHANGIKLDLTAAENLAFIAALRGADDAGVAAALEAAGLAGVGGESARRLSAGQRRRLAIARLKLSRAALWLLDEPLTALDADGRAFVAGLIDEHARGGGITVVATHESPLPPSAEVRHLRLG